MKTISFVGSDKNAGKTTALNFIYQKLRTGVVYLTSVGINGEKIDSYEGDKKPEIIIFPETYFITEASRLSDANGKYEIIHIFPMPAFKKNFIFGKGLVTFSVILEGPNEKCELIKIKKKLCDFNSAGHLLIDGSVDRQFLAHPEISDSFCFALLVSSRKEQLQKANDLLFPLSMPDCSAKHKKIIDLKISENHKSILAKSDGEILYLSNKIPFLDNQLKKKCLEFQNEKCLLYLDGALVKSLFTFLSPFKKLEIVLNNFTLYQNINLYMQKNTTTHNPPISLYHPVTVDGIFIKEEAEKTDLSIPAGIPIHNLFREDFNEIGI